MATEATSSSAKASEDVDTCRICRGEATAHEPLFYPCKCSGSIKFVHQECLMEWLSHSQKKYCELCKTSFRFTKLYHPGMPTRIPTSVFVRRAAIHVLKMFVTWCRGVLVGAVWLVVLPWCMRVVWRSLFWVGDGSWSHDLYNGLNETTLKPTPLPPWDLNVVRSAVESAKTANTSVALPLPSLLMPFSHTLNMTAGEPTAWSILKRFFFGISYPPAELSSSLNMTHASVNVTADALGSRSPSLLSNITVLHWFSSQAANRFLVDVLEGQIITLLVVVAFILVFLIREWVVQQQPVINMVALGENAPAGRAREPLEHEPEDDGEDDEQEAEEDGVRVYDTASTADIPEDQVEEREAQPTHRLHQHRSASEKRRAIFRMWRDSDEIPEELRRALQAGSADEIASVIDQMPLEESVRVKEHLIRLSEQLNQHDSAIHENDPNSPKTEESDGYAAEASGSYTSHSYNGQESSLRQESSATPDTNSADSPGPLQRPKLPSRDRSFLATDVRRNMEECNTWSFDNAPQSSGEAPEEANGTIPDTWDDEVEVPVTIKEKGAVLSEPVQDSEISSESWQQVPEIVVDNTDLNDGSACPRNKGKAKAIGDDSDKSQDGTSDISQAIIDTDIALTNASECGSDSYRHESDSEEEPLTADQVPEQEPERDLVRPVQPIPRLIDRVLDWLFGDIAPGLHGPEDEVNDEHIVQHIVQDLADEAPFVALAANEPQEPANAPIQDPEVAAAAAQAGIDLDQDAIDDAEDLEGIMELIGMQGPVTGLFQNAMFSAVLISATLACAIWLPYLWGKVVLCVVGNPVTLLIKFPLRFIATLADFVFDTALCIAAGIVYWATQFIRSLVNVFTWGILSPYVEGPIEYVTGPSRSIAESAMDRIGVLMVNSHLFPHPDYLRLSINSHVALRTIQNTTSSIFNQTSHAVGAWVETVATDSPPRTALRVVQQVPVAFFKLDSWLDSWALAYVKAFFSWIWNAKSYKITLDFDPGQSASVAHAAAEQWTTTDRLIAILFGYASFAIAGALYLKRASPISTSHQGRKVESIIADILQQAGGVLKVILIISIEMLVFPLYCGLLLDLALLPLFDNTSIYARLHFARENPWTSGFVHWFIGTCYMFHFALFVSMCRKIMRKGVLYFIRDPDDPTFHPVRDVLERSVTTQLRKIAFSALVYGALVIVCLGGVVWALDQTTSGILPIHWASHAPSLEFPMDLLFYNFLTPLIIKSFKPSDSLHAVYQWWFKRCAKFLRLSNFLFGEKAKEEEGHHVRRTWGSWISGEKGNPEKPVIGEDRRILAEDRGTRVYFMFDGKYVRAPGSDQVRIPKGDPVFVEVDQYNVRKDGKPDEGGVHNSDMVTMVYIPPWFRIRIALFVFAIWVFAASTGVGVTVLPLLFGRWLFSLVIPATVEMNDIHAFSLGAYCLGALAYGLYHLYKLTRLPRSIPSRLSTVWGVAKTTTRFTLRVLRVGYVWTALIFVIPLLMALLLEFYFLMPLHAYLGPHEPHVVHVIQDWTLGFLYARLAVRMVLTNTASRLARAFNAVIADGYFNPNARLATRCFLLPVLFVFVVAFAVPSALAFTFNRTIFASASDTVKSQVWRFSYPLLGLFVLSIWTGQEGVKMLNRWRMVVRDEVYLIGERLHNYGEKRPPSAKHII